MPTIATSLKLPAELKARVDALAEAAGKSPHAFMVEAIENDELVHEAPAIVGCQTPSALAHAANGSPAMR